ncbi:MAG TPA: FkbM family methyltransferase [Chthoniobacterales bacterium]|jgi:FkbM family methyltransferase
MLRGEPADFSREHVVWAYRLFLGREPESEAVIATKLQCWSSLADLQRDLLNSLEYQRNSSESYPASLEPQRTRVVIKEIAPGLRLFVDLNDRHIGQNIVYDLYELNEREFILSQLREGETVIDLGANIGFFSILMAGKVGKSGSVYAFEPLPKNAGLLARSIAENHFDDRVILERAAIGAEPGQLDLISPRRTDNWGGAYLRLGEMNVPQDHEAISVPVLRLDDYRLRRPVSFIKIDVEGAEALVIRGAERLLREDRPTMLCEINPSQLATVSQVTPNELLAAFARLNYRCQLLTQKGLSEPIERYEAREIANLALTAR